MTQQAKYERIAATLAAEIRSGRVLSGDALPSESSLVERFSVSRNTIRRSLSVLTAQGFIQTRVGSGSFVTYEGEVIDDAAGWTVSLSSAGARLQSRILSLTRGPMDLDCPALPIGSDCLRIDRLRFKVETGVGVSLERSRIPWQSSFEGVVTHGLIDGSITQTMEHHNVASVGGREWANVECALSAQMAALIGRNEGEPMLRLHRIARGADNSVVEYVESLLDPELFGLSFEY